jgi:DNA-binding CsgD family transcriptional regulator
MIMNEYDLKTGLEKSTRQQRDMERPQPCNKEEFEAALKQLTSKQQEILNPFLEGKSDEEIAYNLSIDRSKSIGRSNVSRHISNICATFGLKNRQGEHFGHKIELVELFMRFKPSLVSDALLGRFKLGPRWEAPDTPGRPIKADCEAYYIKLAHEDRYHEGILNPGALIRIRSPQKMGKTSLLNRFLKTTTENGYYSVLYSLRNKLNHSDLKNSSEGFAAIAESFFRNLADELSIDIKDFPLNKDECTEQLEEILLEIDQPIVIAIDEADILFEYPVVARDFFELLRVWHDAHTKPLQENIWGKLRLIIVHSTDNYILLDRNNSPFDNVGEFIGLQPFNEEECQRLAARYHLNLPEVEVRQLAQLVGGHPFLMQKALYSLHKDKIPFEQLLQEAPSLTGIFRNHLQELLQVIESNSLLKKSLRKVIASKDPVILPLEPTFKLEGLGLVKLQQNQVMISSELYRRFFKDWLYAE